MIKMDKDSEIDDFSDDEIDDKSYKKLVENVSKLGKSQYVANSTRTEPTTKISEYDLVKSVTGKAGAININQLTKGLANRSKHVNIQKKLKKVIDSKKTLAKPLEKPEAQKIRRLVGFEKAKGQLDRWDAIVTNNRVSDNLTFPLPKGSFDPNPKTPADLVAGFHLKSELQLEMEKLNSKPEVYEIEDQFPLSLEEIMEKRQEMAKLRAHQSYIEAKAKRQGKIKSKKFHRVQKRERMKQQLKDFEELQKTNPEEALRKLDEIEKARAEERVSLRHKSTGKWAKSKLVRAKYDKETRQVLAQQLTLSKELTQKISIENSSDSEVDIEVSHKKDASGDTNNPWIKSGNVKTFDEINNFVSGYRKFWDERKKTQIEEVTKDVNCIEESENKIAIDDPTIQKENNKLDEKQKSAKDAIKCDLNSGSAKKQQSGKKNKNLKKCNNDVSEKNKSKEIQGGLKCTAENEINAKKNMNSKLLQNKISEGKTNNRDISIKKEKKVDKSRGNYKKSMENGLDSARVQNDLGAKKNKKLKTSIIETKEKHLTAIKKPKLQKVNSISGQFAVEEVANETTLSLSKSMDLSELFDNAEDKISEKLAKQLTTLRKKLIKEESKAIKESRKKKKTQEIMQEKKNLHGSTDLSFPTRAKRPVIDEELLTGNDEEDAEKIAQFNKMLGLLTREPEEKTNPNENALHKKSDNIDPNKFITMKPSDLHTELPDLVNIDDENNDEQDDNDEQREMISAAFEDDDVVDEFAKDKKAEVDKDKVGEVDLFLPGWGSWGGKNINTSTRKRKRFIVKFPQQEKRRDENKGNLIVNESAAKKVKEHMVSELPFPFKTVKDFEASIRAPIGSTFVTEQAHRKFTQPAVTTKMGTVIEPMCEDQLLNKKKPSGKIIRN